MDRARNTAASPSAVTAKVERFDRRFRIQGAATDVLKALLAEKSQKSL